MASPMQVPSTSDKWTVELSKDWDVLGPFPIHAREQYFLSPSFPLEIEKYYAHEPSKCWPSSLSKTGEVQWTSARADDEGGLVISFPDADWDKTRLTEGWAALQYHSVLRTTLTVYPPQVQKDGPFKLAEHRDSAKAQSVPFRLRADLKQGTQFTIMSRNDENPICESGNASGHESSDDSFDVEDASVNGDEDRYSDENFDPEGKEGDDEGKATAAWYPGNIYALQSAPPTFVDLPSMPYLDQPTTYDVFLSGDYEIRLFGDPQASGDRSPTLRMNFTLEQVMATKGLIRVATLDVIPDFVDGLAFGQAIGVGLQSRNGWWIVRDVTTDNEFPPELTLSLQRQVEHHTTQKLALRNAQRIAPTQTRIVPLVLRQNAPCFPESLTFLLDIVEAPPLKDVTDKSLSLRVKITLKVRQLKFWTSERYDAIRASYFFAGANPTLFIAKPPSDPRQGGSLTPILALHGAGVNILLDSFWEECIPRQKHSWIVIPTGRTEWGLDWHGSSAKDAWATVSALTSILNIHHVFHDWRLVSDEKVVLLGHSNGGQGVWYMSSRFPDRVIAAIPAAGYIKSQAYVPLTQSRSAHFSDPSLQKVLESSLTPDDNDLFLSNLVGTPILIIHGGNDTNVPTWHSRQYYAGLRDWGSRNVSLHIDEGKPHWYPEIYKSQHVHEFLQNSLKGRDNKQPEKKSFTLTVVNPAHSGSMNGWTINASKISGRIARLNVSKEEGFVFVHTTNVHKFTIASSGGFKMGRKLVIDKHSKFGLPDHFDAQAYVYDEEGRRWKVETGVRKVKPSWDLRTSPKGFLHGRAQDILDSPSTHTIVVDGTGTKIDLSGALRLAQMLNVYHKLDADILTSHEALQLLLSPSLTFPSGNIISLGSHEFTREMINHHHTPFALVDDLFEDSTGYKYRIDGKTRRVFDEPGSGLLISHSHPTSSEARLLILTGVDTEGLERTVRAFPYRTGITVPDWLVIGRDADQWGAAGISGAGVFSNFWGHNDQMTWL